VYGKKIYLSEETVKALQDRLSRIEGHVRGVSRMLEEHKSCDDILLQLSAVQAALAQVGKLLLEEHLECCVLTAVKTGDGVTAVKELKRALANAKFSD